MIFNPRVVQLTGARIALLPPSDLAASAGNTQVSLTWTDPGDETSGGQVVAEWEFTRIVRKVGSAPVNQNDGVIVLDSTVKNQYLSEPFVDTGLTNGTTYYYGAFACSAAGAWSDGTFVSAVPVAGTPLGNLVEGTLITIKENGAPVEFYVADHNYQSDLNGDGRTLLIRKNCYDKRPWNSQKTVIWRSSTIFSWLNSTYKSLFSNYVQNAIGTTSYYYGIYSNNYVITQGSSPIFLPSAYEITGNDMSTMLKEGNYLPVAESIRNATIDGSAAAYWTRSIYANYPTMRDPQVWDILPNSDESHITPTYNAICSRPCFTLPSTALVDPSNALIES